MRSRSMRLAYAIIAIAFICNVAAEFIPKATKGDVGSLNTQEIEEQLQVFPLSVIRGGNTY